jgi:hypothetical protein
MANLKQKLTYEQTFIVEIDNSGSAPYGHPATITEVPVVKTAVSEVNATELTRTEVIITNGGGDLIVSCNEAASTVCYAFVESPATNAENVIISFVDQAATSTDIAILAPGESLYLPFITNVPAPGACELQGVSLGVDVVLYVSASHNG